MAPHDTRGAAGGIQQDPVEGPAIPPTFGVSGIGSQYMGAPDAPSGLSRGGCSDTRNLSGILRQQRYLGTPKIIRNYGCTIRIDVECPDLAVSHLEQMRRLAARGCTGIQDPLTRLRIEQLGRTLGPDVLHAHQSISKARNAIHRQGLVQHQPVLAHQTKADARFLQPCGCGKLPPPDDGWPAG